MSVSNVHTLFACSLGGTLFDGLLSNPLDLGIRGLQEAFDGGVDPTFSAVAVQEPMFGLTTVQCGAALTAVGLSGLALTSGSPGLFYLQKMVDGAERGGAGAHVKMTVNKGHLIPVQLVAGIGVSDFARLSYMCHCIYDGTNLPVVVATSQSLAGSPSVAAMFRAGTFTFNGSEIDGVQRIQVDFGIELKKLWAGGSVYPTFSAVRWRKPRIVVETVNALSLDTLTALGSAISSTAVVKFRKYAQGGAMVADATAEHISLTLNEGRCHPEGIENANGEVTGHRLVVTPTYNGSDAILVAAMNATM